jgi:hypothetical protein
MFSSNNDGIPNLTNYADALHRFERTKPWRGYRDTDARPLDKNRALKHKTIRKGNDGTIYCRLHATDCVIFYADGRIDVDMSYSSVTTDSFIARVTSGMPMWFTSNADEPVVWLPGVGGTYHWDTARGFLIEGDTAHFDADGGLTNARPITHLAIKPHVARQLRNDYGYPDFMLWRRAYETMNGQPDFGYKSRDNPNYRPNDLRRLEVVEFLQDRGGDGWKDLSSRCSNDHILQCLYQAHPEVIATREEECFIGQRAYQNWRSLDRKYRAILGYRR